jgi:hypothetical protein
VDEDGVNPTVPDDEELDAAVRALRRALVKHPFAFQSAYAALVREGRAYARTEEGRRDRERLLRSELATHLRSAWEIVSFGMLGEPSSGSLPSSMVEALVRSVLGPCFEARLHRGLRSSGTEEVHDEDD